MKYLIVLAVLISTVHCVEYKEDTEYSDAEDNDYVKPNYNLKDAVPLFQKFIHDYNKTYDGHEDYNKHYDAFVKNLKDIIENNANGGGSVSDINSFADFNDEELAKLTG